MFSVRTKDTCEGPAIGLGARADGRGWVGWSGRGGLAVSSRDAAADRANDDRLAALEAPHEARESAPGALLRAEEHCPSELSRAHDGRRAGTAPGR